MSKETVQIDYASLGYCAFPSSRGYPTRDKCTAKDESDYIGGWLRAKTEREIDRQFG